ncbi:MAG: translation initiation factor IF-3 C-terminal domain-containing protein, partial [Herpetosiphonaceae bacterium]|nr:translation initiation factor IF-3 C-terminal domain-containing protein [Herpetosiphonaceae bacterium]
IEVRTTQARQFLKEGDKVKFVVRFRGRQLAHTDIGMKMLLDIAESLRDVATIEQRPLPEGKSYTLLIAPGAAKAPKRERPAPIANAPQAPVPQVVPVPVDAVVSEPAQAEG